MVDCHPNFLVALRGSHPHSQAEVPIGVEKLLAFKLSSTVKVVSHEDVVDVVLEELIMDIAVPSSGVVNHNKAVHLMVVAVVAPTVEGVVVVAVVTVVSVMAVMVS